MVEFEDVKYGLHLRAGLVELGAADQGGVFWGLVVVVQVEALFLRYPILGLRFTMVALIEVAKQFLHIDSILFGGFTLRTVKLIAFAKPVCRTLNQPTNILVARLGRNCLRCHPIRVLRHRVWSSR